MTQTKQIQNASYKHLKQLLQIKGGTTNKTYE